MEIATVLAGISNIHLLLSYAAVRCYSKNSRGFTTVNIYFLFTCRLQVYCASAPDCIFSFWDPDWKSTASEICYSSDRWQNIRHWADSHNHKASSQIWQKLHLRKFKWNVWENRERYMARKGKYKPLPDKERNNHEQEYNLPQESSFSPLFSHFHSKRIKIYIYISQILSSNL